MDFDLSAEQRDLAAAAADFLGDAADLAAVRAALDDADAPAGPVPPGRKALVESGFATITVPEEHGGGGGTLLDLAVVAEQAGRVLAGPSLVTYARAAELLAGDADRLAALAAGDLAVAVRDGGPVLDAIGADTFLARDGDAVVVASGVVSARDAIDASRGLADVALGETAPIPGDADRWQRAEQIGRVILAAEGLGAAARSVELGVAYTKERHAFGRPIGSYQAVKHALVDAYVEVEQLRSLVWWAAWAADEDPSALPLASSAAKAAAASALERAAETLIQVHGGIGFTWEHDAHLYWRRAKVDRLLLGDEVAALDAVARIALDAADGAGR